MSINVYYNITKLTDNYVQFTCPCPRPPNSKNLLQIVSTLEIYTSAIPTNTPTMKPKSNFKFVVYMIIGMIVIGISIVSLIGCCIYKYIKHHNYQTL